MKILICLASLFALLTLVFAQEKQTAPTSALQAMVDTERAFSKRAADEGVRPAFVAFIADDGILFRPTAVNGKKWFSEHPVPASDKRPLLSWYPSFADISLAGDMGYTTGPWERRNDIHDADAVAWGNFLTVWKRQPDNSFKFVIDLGISNPKPEQVAAPWQPSGNEMQSVGGLGPRNKQAGVGLTAREHEFAAASAKRGVQIAFAEAAATDVRLFRNGRQPIVGKANAVNALRDVEKWTWEPAFADVARSGDLGYSYGSYELTKTDPALKPEERVERGNYFRIWKRVSANVHFAEWQVVTDLLDPIAPSTKN